MVLRGGYDLHIALAILQTFDDQGNIALLQRIHHAAPFALDAQDALQPHILQMMGGQRLLAAEFFTDLRYR